MANKRITELGPAASLPAGTQFIASTLSASVKKTAATISFDASDHSIRDSANGFVAAGFVAGDQVKVTGAAAAENNVFSATVTSVTAGKLVTNAAGILTAAAGPAVTVTRWDSQRVDIATLVAALGGGPGGGDMSTVTALAIASGVVNIDCSLGDYFTLALTANVTGITFSNLPASGHGASKLVRITQDATPRTVAWPASFKWAGGTAGAVSTASAAVDVLAISSFDAGTTWRATLSKAFA